MNIVNSLNPHKSYNNKIEYNNTGSVMYDHE